ncbi:DUF2867 domain-containing protein [Caenispirillum bisanense]|uniref:DUF2867 domain-containing protein n=1 Tax=Caenispirillum bisanense TaxID=414052 RepID=UPI0031E0AFCC
MTSPALHLSADAVAHLVAPADELDYVHRRTVRLARPVDPVEAWRLLLSRPMPVLAWAFRVRDAVSARFGVARIGGFGGTVPAAPAVGDRIDFFLVEHVSADRLTLSARDRHLDVVVCLTTQGNVLTVTTSVKTHNAFGRLYMVPVAPAHGVIVAVMLRRLRRQLAA